jgi:serine/threonine-protein kinase HipA
VTRRAGVRGRTSGTLAVWTNGNLVGHWELIAGEHRFRYHDDWLTSPSSRRLSLSLPFTPGNVPHRGEVVRNFFDNLLPDSDAIRRRLQEKFSTPGIDAFDLLSAIGRDCVGAVQLLPDGAQPTGWDQISAAPLDEAGVERAIDTAIAAGRVLGQSHDEDLRISLAGAQEKTALLWHRNKWCRPLGATPTTHIFKLPLGLVGNMRADMSGSVENEWLCSRLLSALGLSAASCEIVTFGRRKVLVVERFDRSLATSPAGRPWLARLPQEDFCQVLGLPGALKYESDGGPGVRALLRILDTSTQAESDKESFLLTLLAFWLLAATDGHAKNFSIFLERGGGYRLTPLYDVLSAWPIIGNGPNQIAQKQVKLSMALRSKNTHYNVNEIQTRHWQAFAREAGVPFAAMTQMIERIPSALDAVEAQLPLGFPEKIWQPVRAGMLAQALRFGAGLE